MSATIRWDGLITATSSIVHGGDTRGTITSLRREKIIQPDGRILKVPVITGNNIRGTLRRIGERLTRDTLRYEGHLSLAAAHVLEGGGQLAKTSGQALEGARLHHVRSLVPQFSVFGGSAGARVHDGCASNTHARPLYHETRHVLPTWAQDQPLVRMFDAAQVEMFVQQDTRNGHAYTKLFEPPDDAPLTEDGDLDFPQVNTTTPSPEAEAGPDSTLLVYRIETFPAGTRFAISFKIENATPIEAAFYQSVLEEFITEGRIGGRRRVGHGQITGTITPTVLAGNHETADWREHLTNNREAALEAINELT